MVGILNFCQKIYLPTEGPKNIYLKQKNPLIGQIYFLGEGRYIYSYMLCVHTWLTLKFSKMSFSEFYLHGIFYYYCHHKFFEFLYTPLDKTSFFQKFKLWWKVGTVGLFISSLVIIFPRKNVLRKLLYLL